MRLYTKIGKFTITVYFALCRRCDCFDLQHKIMWLFTLPGSWRRQMVSLSERKIYWSTVIWSEMSEISSYLGYLTRTLRSSSYFRISRSYTMRVVLNLFLITILWITIPSCKRDQDMLMHSLLLINKKKEIAFNKGGGLYLTGSIPSDTIWDLNRSEQFHWLLFDTWLFVCF